MSSPKKHTFLITGSSSGLGLHIALTALRAGHSVIGTARSPSAAKTSHPEFESLGGHWLALDVTSPSTTSTISAAVRTHDVDVLINSAGVAAIGPLEDFSEDEIKHQFDINVYGPLRVIKGALPVFRERYRKHRAENPSGDPDPKTPITAESALSTIINISSAAGIVGIQTRTLYSASKFALEGATESLSLELAPFRIRTLLVVPGAFKTNFSSNSLLYPANGFGAEYMAPGNVVGDTVRMHQDMGARSMLRGDPAKAGERVVEWVEGRGLGARVKGLRMVLGVDGLGRVREKVRVLERCVEENGAMDGEGERENLAGSTDLEGWGE
ncbi:hypothetical protein MMC10_001915 [Thelotrema lepadinum]|nr:hypothetical protein [Thelotrema lepadinum]